MSVTYYLSRGDVFGPTSCGLCISGNEDTVAQEAVRDIQIMLAGMGLLSTETSATGFYGNDTYQAVLTFQQRAHPNDSGEWDGRVGQGTYDAILRAYETMNAMRAAGDPQASDPEAALDTAIQRSTPITQRPWFWPAIALSVALMATRVYAKRIRK